ncbi:MAG: hypothetical protein JWO46_2183 [Nocardioidaceae bacterium]|nr:hypothetical protein [Nocardioidaceae bacterium]
MSSRRRSLVLRWLTGFLVLALAAGVATLHYERSEAASGTRRAAPSVVVHPPAPRLSPGPTPAVPPITLPRGADRPNVMLVMTDDMRWDELKYMPNVRKYVEDRGLRFTNAFSPYPLCCPARSSFLLGKYAHNHHVLYHTAPYGFGSIDDSHTIGGALQSVGYRTALIGKYLNGYGVMPSKVTGKSSIHYVPDGWTDWMAGLDTIWPAGSPYAGNTYDYFSMTQNINGRTVSNAGKYSAEVVGDETIGLVDKYAPKSGQKPAPWFMWVTPVAPHFGGPVEPDDPKPYLLPSGVLEKFETPARPDWVKGRFDAEIDHAPGTRRHGPSEADISDKPRNIRKWKEATPVENRRVRDIERQRAESLYAWDVDFGRIVAELKRTGQFDKTLIMFTSDNGYYTGEHRQRQGKIKPHEPVIHVPLLVAGPGVSHGVRQAPVTTFDLTTTILDIAGTTMPEQDGESKAPVIYGPDQGWVYPMLTEGLIKDVKVTKPGFTKGGLTEVGIRTGRWKYVRYANGDQELYDLLEDPNELQSRIGDPKYAAIQAELSRLWGEYEECKAEGCRVPLPASLQSSVADLAAQSKAARQAIRTYYDN